MASNNLGWHERKHPNEALKGTTEYFEIYQSIFDEKLYYVDQNGVHRLISTGYGLPVLTNNGNGTYTHFDGNSIYQSIDVNANVLPYDNTGTGLTSTNVQDAINELVTLANNNIYTNDGTIADVLRTVDGAGTLVFSTFARVSFFSLGEFRIEGASETHIESGDFLVDSPLIEFDSSAGEIRFKTVGLGSSQNGSIFTLVDDTDGHGEWSTWKMPTSPGVGQDGYVLTYDSATDAYVLVASTSLAGTFNVTDGIDTETVNLGGNLTFSSNVSKLNFSISAGPEIALNLETTGANSGDVLIYNGSGDLAWSTVNLNNLFTANLTLGANRSHGLATYSFKIAHSTASILEMTTVNTIVGFYNAYMSASNARIDFSISAASVASASSSAFGFNVDARLANQKCLLFYELTANGTSYVGFKAPASLSANTIWTLPAADGTSGQVLSTDGSGTLSWTSAALSFSFTLTDGSTSQTISNTDTLTVSTGDLLSAVVSATDTLTISIDTTGATSGQVLTYNGSTVVWSTPTNTSFVLTDGITNVTITTGESFLFTAGTGLFLETATGPERLSIELDAELNDLNDVVIFGPSDNEFLRYNGSSWVNEAVSLFTGFSITDGSTTEAVSSAGTVTFQGVDLIAATVVGTSTVRYSLDVSGLSGGEIIVFNNGTGSAEWGSPASALSFTISDGSNSQTVVPGNTIIFSEGAGMSVGVSATDTVTIALDASLANLSDVDPALTPTNGQVLTYNSGTNRWEASSAGGAYSFIISDGSTSQTIASGNTLTFAVSGTGLAVAVSATDTVTYTISTAISWANGTSTLTVNGETVDINQFAYTSTEQVIIGNPLAGAGTGKLLITGDASSAPLLQLYGYNGGTATQRLNVTEDGITTLTSKGSGSVTLTGESGAYTQKLILNPQRTVSTNPYAAIEFTNISDRDFAIIYGNDSTPYFQIFAYDVNGSTAYQKPVLTAFTENSNATAGRIYIGGKHGASAGTSGLYEWAQTSPRHDIVLHASQQGTGKSVPESGTIWLIDPSLIDGTDTRYNSPKLTFMTRTWDGAAERDIEDNLTVNLWINQTASTNASDGHFNIAVGGLGGAIVNRTIGMNSDGAVALGYDHTSVTWTSHALRVYSNIHSGNVRLDGYANTREDGTSPDNLLYTDSNGVLQSVAFEDIFLQREVTASGTTYTLVLTDQSKTVKTTNGSAVALEIPTNASVAFPVGTSIEIFQYGAGQVTVTGAGGVTLRQPDGNKIVAQYNRAVLTKIGTDEWDIQGALTV